MDTKQQMLKAIEDLPDDAKVEDALERLYLLYKIERGGQQADGGNWSAKPKPASEWRNG